MSESAITKESILEELSKVFDPELKRDIVSLGMVKEVAIQDAKVFIHLEVASKVEDLREKIKAAVKEQLQGVAGVADCDVQVSSPVPKAGGVTPKSSPAQCVIAVASGKGGVGKSTVSVNLAMSLVRLGKKVGLMDGDIYGPNIPLMLGVPHDKKPLVNNEDKLIPIDANGLKMISMGILVPPDQPMVWRGPMLHSAVNQFLSKVEWGELDFLIVDLPPGTGDVQLSLVQSAPLTGAVIVTTPQEVALMDVRKGVAMFQKTQVPILGVVENMAGDVFGEGGGEKAAEQFNVPFLGRIPLEKKIREFGDAGTPIAISEPESVAAGEFARVAQTLENKLLQPVSN